MDGVVWVNKASGFISLCFGNLYRLDNCDHNTTFVIPKGAVIGVTQLCYLMTYDFVTATL